MRTSPRDFILMLCCRNAVYHHRAYGPHFGNVFDFSPLWNGIECQCNDNGTYAVEERCGLAGAGLVRCEEVEVFAL